MLHISKETKLSQEQVLDRARAYFGPDGIGLEIKDECDTDARFEGGGGYVYVGVCATEAGGTDVTIETAEWEHQVRDFLRHLEAIA